MLPSTRTGGAGIAVGPRTMLQNAHTIKFQAQVDESSPIQFVIGVFLIQKTRYGDGQLNGTELAGQKLTHLHQLTGIMLQ